MKNSTAKKRKQVPAGYLVVGVDPHKKNMRAILQLFGIKVIVYLDRVEIKGTIPSQVLYKREKPEPETGLVITSPSPYQGEGRRVF